MYRPLYLFNPEHDLALANSDLNFNAPLSARQLAHDMDTLPLWYASQGSLILSHAPDPTWLKTIHTLFPDLKESIFLSNPDFSRISTIHPWGWDNPICKQLSLLGAGDDLLPSTDLLCTIRQLSHRRIAIHALEFLHRQAGFNQLLSKPSIEISTVEDIENYVNYNTQAIFKAPWSGSGKGLCWSRGKMTDSRRGWCRNIINKQGSIIAEPIYDKLQDFAMEFECLNGIASFAGYSLFETEKGIYRGNLLMNDNRIFNTVINLGIPSELLGSVQNQLQQFIETTIAPHYSGMLGIDLFVYEENGKRKLHPCVEINLRMTMGCVARIFFDRFVSPDATGRFYVDHYPAAGELWQDHLQRTKEQPIITEKGKISKGYLALTDVTSQAHYRARVEIE